jgi:phosphonate transport system ATP-binding protein
MPTSPAWPASSGSCDVLDGGALLTLSGLAVAPEGAAVPVLSGIDLTLARGECVALVAPSGTGKTTLLRTIAGLLPPLGGSIGFAGRERGGIALVAQHHDLVEALRVDKNVLAGRLGRMSTWTALRLLLRTAPAEMDEAEAALAMVGLEGMARRRTAELSGGERQRVAIARALVQAPALLLADEPVAALDPVTAEAVLGLLTGLARTSGTALLCSLHQPDLAHRYCDRVIDLGQRAGA